MATVQLTTGEIQTVRILARLRYLSNREAGIANRRIGPQSDENTDLDGLGAEVAAAKFLNVYPDLTVNPRSGGADLALDGYQVDVKHTRYTNGRLLATLKKAQAPADIYVLVTGTFPNYELVGWATGSELIRQENITDLGWGNGYALEQSQLHREFRRLG